MKKTICTAIALAIVSFGTAFAADLNKDDAFCTVVTSINDDIDAAISKWQCLKVEHRPKLALADRVLKLYPENFWKSSIVCINT